MGHWSTRFAAHGVSGFIPGAGISIVNALRWHGGELYVGGAFTHGGPVLAPGVAVWSPTLGWRALGAGLSDQVVDLVVAGDGTVYATTGSNAVDGAYPAEVHRWNGTSWSLIGTSDRQIYTLGIDDDGSLLAGGVFLSIDGTSASGLARWDGSHWSEVVHPGTFVNAIYVDAMGTCIGGRDYAGYTDGYVACHAPGAPSVWTPYPIPSQPGPPWPNPVDSITRDAMGRLIVAGAVVLDSARVVGGVARWEGTRWAILDVRLSDTITDQLEVLSVAAAPDGRIWAAGEFQWIGPSSARRFANHVAVFGSTSWSPVGFGVQGNSWNRDGAVVLPTSGGDVFVGGGLTEAQNFGSAVAASRLVRVDVTGFHALTHPADPAHGIGRSYAVASRGPCGPYVSGDFDVVDDGYVDHVGALGRDDTLSDLFGPTVTRTALSYGGDLLAVMSDGTLVSRVGIWRTGAHDWAPLVLPHGAAGQLRTMTVDDDGTLIAAGDWVDTTDPSMSGLARWNGTSWTAIASAPAPDPIDALLVHDGTLYAATSTADPTTLAMTGSVVRWDGHAWADVGSTSDGAVTAMVWQGGTLVVGVGAYGTDSPYVYRAMGGTLAPIGGLFSPSTGQGVGVAALAVVGDTLIAGGNFGVEASGSVVGAAVLGASGWTPLAGGLDGSVASMTPTDRGLLLVGSFEAAGGVASVGIARLEPP